MKKIIAIMAVAAMICLACTACGCSNSAPATMPTNRPTTPSTMPSTIMPTMETNIPDPEVNDNSTMDTQASDSTGNAGINGTAGANDGSSAARNRSMTGGMK